MGAAKTLAVIALASIGWFACKAEASGEELESPVIAKTDCGSFVLGQSDVRMAKEVLTPLLKLPELTNRDGRLEKDEFETSSAFEQREAQFWLRALGEDLVVATVKPVSFSYDADRQIMKLTRLVSTTYDRARPQLALITFDHQEQVVDTYEAQNAYGVQREVDVFATTSSQLAFPEDRLPSLFSNDGSGVTTVYMKAAPERARELKERGRLVFIGRLEAPWLEKVRSGYEAIVDDPTKRTYTYNRFRVAPICMAIVLDDQVIFEDDF